jgi:hypothetical protein
VTDSRTWASIIVAGPDSANRQLQTFLTKNVYAGSRTKYSSTREARGHTMSTLTKILAVEQ